MKHRCNIAIGSFGEYRTVLTTRRLPQRLKLRLYGTLIVSTMAYGSCAWLFVDHFKTEIKWYKFKIVSYDKQSKQFTKKQTHHHMMW